MQEGSPRSAHDSLPAGTAIEDKYVIASDDVVGRGAWSVVKRCVLAAGYSPPGAQPGMSFVVKIIEKDYLISLTKGDVERAMAEVRREIDTLRHIPPHENVVTFIEHVETERYFLLFFEEVRCGDLCELILQRPTGKLHESEAKLYVYQLIKAVLHCHVHDVIHRDIKPENLLVSDDDTIKLTDFGLAKRARGASSGKDTNNSNNTNSGSDALDPDALAMPYPGCERLVGKRITCSDVIGTPRYGAPEMFYAKFTQTHYDGYAADTWSIGVVTYIALSGSFPFSASASASEKEVFTSIMDAPLVPPADVTPMALDFVECLLNKDPTTRLPLYAALTHPWLAEVVVPRASIVAMQIRGQCDKTGVGNSNDDNDRSSSSSSSDNSGDDNDESDAAFATTMGNGSGSRRAQRPSRRRGHRARVTAEVAAACARFDEEARQLHVCIARLQHELFRLQRKQQQQQHEQQQAHDTHRDSRSERSGNKSMSSRARTPCGYDDGLSSSSSSSAAAAAMLHMRGSRASAARARVVSPARALGATYGGLSMMHANGAATTMTTAAAAASNGMLRGRMASRDNSSLYNNNNNGHGVGSATASLRSKTPLARSAGGAAVRRGTPARTAGTTPRRCATPVRATTALLAASSNGSATTATLRATSAARTSGRGSSLAATAHNVSSASSSPAHLGGVRSGARAMSTRTSAATSLGWTSVSNNNGSGSSSSTHGRATSAARGATPTRATAYSRPRGSHALSSSPATMGGGLGATPVKMTASSHSNNNSSYSVNVNGYTSNSNSSNNGGGGDGSNIVVGSNATAATAAASSRLYNNNTHSSGSGMSVGNDLRLGDQVTYKGCRAVVRFNGTTTFGAGVWIGLEMLEGNEGTNDGSSFIDKRQYFTCPKGKGVFVRASQVKRL